MPGSATPPPNTPPGASAWVQPPHLTKISSLSRFASLARDAVFLAGLVGAVLTFFGTIAFQWAWPTFIDRLREDLNVVTREDLSRIEEQLNQVTGEDRLIRMPNGHSFVREPVSIGEPINLTLVVGETRRGEKCNLIEITPLFMDERAIPTAGDTVPPPAQLHSEPRRFHLNIAPPTSLTAGRVALNLSMKFSCPFGPNDVYIDVFEETSSIFFQLDP